MNNYFYYYEIKNFLDIKKYLIDLILKDPYGITHENITKTDFYSSKKGDWLSFFQQKILKNFCTDFIAKTNSKKLLIQNCWYQIYNKGDYHERHVHSGTNFTNVFYLQLPSLESATTIDNSVLRVREGSIATFPGFIPHESKKNIYEKSKIIISFNSSLELE